MQGLCLTLPGLMQRWMTDYFNFASCSHQALSVAWTLDVSEACNFGCSLAKNQPSSVAFDALLSSPDLLSSGRAWSFAIPKASPAWEALQTPDVRRQSFSAAMNRLSCTWHGRRFTAVKLNQLGQSGTRRNAPAA
jgi:hypothetical protein